MDQFYVVLGVLFVVGLVAQVFEKPARRLPRRPGAFRVIRHLPVPPARARANLAHQVTIGFVVFAVGMLLAHNWLHRAIF